MLNKLTRGKGSPGLIKDLEREHEELNSSNMFCSVLDYGMLA